MRQSPACCCAARLSPLGRACGLGATADGGCAVRRRVLRGQPPAAATMVMRSSAGKRPSMKVDELRRARDCRSAIVGGEACS